MKGSAGDAGIVSLDAWSVQSVSDQTLIRLKKQRVGETLCVFLVAKRFQSAGSATNHIAHAGHSSLRQDNTTADATMFVCQACHYRTRTSENKTSQLSILKPLVVLNQSHACDQAQKIQTFISKNICCSLHLFYVLK